MYRLKINGKSYVEVQGTESWTKTIVRDFNDRIFRTKGEFEFKGWDELFDLLYEHIRAKGVCNSLNGRVYLQDTKLADFQEWWRGEIKMQDIEFDLIKDSADAQVLDDVWAAKFANNNKQKVFLRSTRAKNGASITSCPYSLCDLFDPSDGTYNAAEENRLCFNVFDAFTFLVDYHTDGAVTFASDYFETGDGIKYYLTSGEEIRTGNNNANLEISFEDLFDEMNKKFCLFIIIDVDDFDNPVLRIEPQSYVFANQRALTVNDPENIKMQVDLDQLYSIIKVGSNQTEFDNSDNANFITPRFYAWGEEEYNGGGDCQFQNNTLDLVSSWKIDTNSIEQQLYKTDPGHDNDIFILEIDPYLQAYQYDNDFTSSSTVAYIYNENLTNKNVITNWFDGIPEQVYKDLSEAVYLKVIDPPDTLQVPGLGWQYNTSAGGSDAFAFVTEINDVPNYYTITLDSGYKSGNFQPLVNAFYKFDGFVNVDTVTGSSVVTLQPVIRVYEDTTWTTLIVEYPQNTVNYGFNGQINIIENVWIPTNAVARVEMDSGSSGLVYFNQCELEVTKSDIQYNQSNTQPLIYQYDINKFKLTVDQFNTLDNNLGYIRFIDTKKNLSYDVWATELKYNPLRQIVEVGKFLGRPPIVECEWLLLGGQWDDEGCWDDNNIWIDPESAWFIMTVKTDNAGVSAANQFLIPTTGGGYDYIVDWGDGVTDTGLTGNKTHTYSAPGTYTVKVTGAFPRIFFNNTNDDTKVLSIEQWGNIAWSDMSYAFSGCANMALNAIDAPNLSNVTALSYMFFSCSIMNGNIGHWDVSSIQNFDNLFFNCAAFNNGGSDSINNWDVSSATTFLNIFRAANAFNQPLDQWSTSNVTTLLTAFRDAISFDQDIGAWDISNITTASNMFNGVTLSTANYDALLTGWTGWSGGAATRSVPAGINFSAGGSTYSLGTDAEDARTYLDITQTWTITDGGGV